MMSSIQTRSSTPTISQTLLNIPMSILVKSTAIPSDPIEDLNIHFSSNKPIIYALPFRSNVDLLTLRKQTAKFGLPDPLEPIEINGQIFPRYVFITSRPTLVQNDQHVPRESIQVFSQLLAMHEDDLNLDIQVIPTTVLWGRKPGKEGKSKPYLEALNGPQKTIAVLISGRDCLVRFSPCVSLRYMADTHGTDETIAHKLARVARIHFSRQKLAASGPRLPNRQALFNRLMQSEIIKKAIQDEANSKHIAVEKVEKEAHDILDEIAANFSYSMIKQGSRVLSWLWNKLYQGLTIHNASTVRRLAQDGHEIVYVPCHRSHIDYLLLSYVLYKEGLVPPHIAAGINLNFFPAGFVFRHGGAFFIRRSFKGNRLYSTIFREYLAELFAKGYSVEYFSEGGRSRTGRLLPAKTGMLTMTVQAMLRGLNRPVTLVPVYIGYEHVIEVNTYAKELRGKHKEKENAGLVLRTLRKLRNFGQGYINFGEPIQLNQYLNEHIPEWTKDISSTGVNKPHWLTPTVNQLAVKMMSHINDAAAISALSLCATALLASSQRALSRDSLISQVDFYLSLLRNVPYSATSTVPSDNAKQLVEHALALESFEVESDSIGDIISLDRHQSILMTYYRNNIIHLLALPSLIAQMIVRQQNIHIDQIQQNVQMIYPFLQAELFLSYKADQLDNTVITIINQLEMLDFISQKEQYVRLNQAKIHSLMLLGHTITETLQRYAIAVNLLEVHPDFDKKQLEKRSQDIAQRLGHLHGINAPEFFDKGVFSALFTTLVQQGYLDHQGEGDTQRNHQLAQTLYAMLNPEIRLTIRESIYQTQTDI